MNEPQIVDRKPHLMTLEPGKYFWCACGRSENGNFCDGSHQGTGITPVAFELAETQNVALCACKHTKNPVFCDGSHAALTLS